MDLGRLEQEYIAHVAGVVQPHTNKEEPEQAPAVESTVNLWTDPHVSAQAMSHVSLRGLLPSVSSPTRKSVGLNISVDDDDMKMDGVGSPVVGLQLPDSISPPKFALSAPKTSFVEWQPHS